MREKKPTAGTLSTEITAAATQIYGGAFGNMGVGHMTPATIARLLKQGEQNLVPELLDLFELMEERDPHYASVLGVRKRAVLGLDTTLSGAVATADTAVQSQQTIIRDDPISEAVQAMLSQIDIYALIEDLLDAIGKGVSVCEIVWKFTADSWTPVRFVWCPTKIFTYDIQTGRQLLIRTEQNAAGEVLAPYKFVVHTPQLKSGRLCRDGVARSAIWNWMIKSYTLHDWVGFCERFGVPLRMGKYDRGADEKEKQALLHALRSLGHDSAAMMPSSMDIVFENMGNPGNNSAVFKELTEYTDRQLSKLILDQTMTTDDGSSMSQAVVHNMVRMDVVIADAKKLAKTITDYVITPFVQLNYGTDATVPQFQFITDAGEDISQLADTLTKLVPLGLQVSATEVREKIGLSAPKTADDVLVAVGRSNDPIYNSGVAGAKAIATAPNKTCPCGCMDTAHNTQHGLDDETALQALVDAMDTDQPYLSATQQALNSSTSMGDVRDKLPEMLDQILNSNTADTANQKAGQCMFAQHMNGRLETAEEVK